MLRAYLLLLLVCLVCLLGGATDPALKRSPVDVEDPAVQSALNVSGCRRGRRLLPLLFAPILPCLCGGGSFLTDTAPCCCAKTSAKPSPSTCTPF